MSTLNSTTFNRIPWNGPGPAIIAVAPVGVPACAFGQWPGLQVWADEWPAIFCAASFPVFRVAVDWPAVSIRCRFPAVLPIETDLEC